MSQVSLFHDNFQSGPGTNITVGDKPAFIRDRVVVFQTDDFKGDVNLIQTELSRLHGIGIVSVSPESEYPDELLQCSWRVTFDSKAGDIPPLLVSEAGSDFFSLSATMLSGDVVTVEDNFVQGTSVSLSGDFALEVSGRRTKYLPFDASATEVRSALSGLFSIGDVQVSREGPNENFGYIWDVTFVESIGTVDLIIPDYADLNGTAATISVSRLVKGQHPPFNGPDYGMITLRKMPEDRSLVIDHLKQGIDYFFRVTARYSVGRNSSTFTRPPKAKPIPQPPSGTDAFTLNVMDGSSIDLSIGAPLTSGGGTVTSFRIDYAEEPFRHERQQLSIQCSPKPEIQRIQTNASDLNEIQYIVIDSRYGGLGIVKEVQRVFCDASGGEFGLGFETDMKYFPYDSNEDFVKFTIESLAYITHADVSFENGSPHACTPGGSSFLITFHTLHGISGNIPLLKTASASLSGARLIEVTEIIRGDAPPSGFFSLSFRGAKTSPIYITSSPSDISISIETELLALDTIESNGVRVKSIPLSSGPELLFEVEFIGNGVGGDVQPLEVEDSFVQGSSSKILIFSDGEIFSAANGVDSFESKPGNSISGSFQLRLRGHLSDEINSNASADELIAALEKLPNIDTVHVEQGPITKENGRSWDITFMSSPGYFPPLTRNFDKLEAINKLKASRVDSNRPSINVEEVQDGDEPLRGLFSLSFSDGVSNESTRLLDSFISADDLKSELERLPNIGIVIVQRIETDRGYLWDIEFNACSFKNGKDICNDGDLPILKASNVNLSGCGGATISVTESVAGSQAGECNHLVDGVCSIFHSVHDAMFPFQLSFDNLTFGTEYFFQVRFRSEYGYSHRSLSFPLSGIPSHNPPGQMNPPHLIVSTATSITIGWEMPNVNGGLAIMGYELWMNEYGAAENELVYDGVGSPDIFQFRISTINIGPNSQTVESGRQYQFQVRATNSCNGPLAAPCFGPFSDMQVFTVRDPRVPQPPPPPWRQAKSVMHPISASISIAWKRPTDNGGSPITGYFLYIKDSRNIITTRSLSFDSLSWTETGLNRGEMYHFYVVAANEIGRSGNSAILTAIAATYPGLGGPGEIDIIQEQLRPIVIDATESSMIVRWSEVTNDYSGGSPIDGYKLYMYNPNMSSSSDLQARQEVQRIQKPNTIEITGTFTLTFGEEETEHIDINASANHIKLALENLRSINIVSVDEIFNGWEILFLSEPGDLPLLKISTGRLFPAGSSLTAEEVIRGDDAVLVFQGRELHTTVENLIAGGYYTFKISAFNTIGDGILSKASKTVLARSGASASQTTASGSSIYKGIAGTIDEVQVITFLSNDCDRDVLSLSFINMDFSTENLCGLSAVEFENAVENLPSVGDIHVTRRDLSSSTEAIGFEWSVTFVSSDGDVPMLVANPLLTKYGTDTKGQMGSAASYVIEHLKGHKNEFIIEPKRASGAEVTDEQVVESSRGDELFFIELWKPITKLDGSHDWVSDGGVASYNPVIYEEQIVSVPDDVESFTLTMDTSQYKPGGRLGGFVATTYALKAPISAEDLKTALDLLENVKRTKVSFVSGNNSSTFIVTFTAIFGEIPLLSASHSHVYIYRNADKAGVTEIQTITLSADTTFRYEIQSLNLDQSQGNITLRFGSKSTNQISYNISDTSSLESLQLELEQELNRIDNIKVTIQVISSISEDLNSTAFEITFLEPVGDLRLLESDNGNVTEVVSGFSPFEGSFVLEFGDQYTTDIPYDSSAALMKEVIESLQPIELVNVEKYDVRTGYKWDISFISNLGNLQNIRAHNNRFEVQRILSKGGYPTPLGGSFTLSYNSDMTASLPFDASSHLIKASLEALPSIGRVDVEVNILDNGQREWMVTFRVPVAPALLLIDYSKLTGTIDIATIEIVVPALQPSLLTLSGSFPEIGVLEKVPGLPSYTGSYVTSTVGSYALSVMQLHKGGLSAWYYDNVWFLDEPSVERIDKSLNFDWGTGPITRYGRDYVSIRWWGKVQPLSTEVYTFYMICNDGGRLYVDHKLVLDDWDNAWEGVMKASVALEALKFYDIKVEFKDHVGAANIVVEWSTFSIPRQTIPSDQLYYGQHISGSPFSNEVTAGASDYPYSDILPNPNGNWTRTNAGEQSHFYIQAKDSQGNLKADYDNLMNRDSQFTVDFLGPSGESSAEVSYVESGKYRADFILLKSGMYKVHVRTGETDIFCGLGEQNKCSPFTLEVLPGLSAPHMCEVESANDTYDSLSEARAGQTGVAYIRARDTFGNNQIRGGDKFEAKFTSLSNEQIQYRGYIIDNGDGSYKLTYSIPVADTYRISVTLNGKPIRHCVGSIPPFIYDRHFDGTSVYSVPNHCLNSGSLLDVIHNSLHAASSTVTSWGDQKGLERATTGIETGFIIESRDKFGNIRSGIKTNRLLSKGNGSSDAFRVKITDAAGHIAVETSSLVQVIRSNHESVFGYFRIQVANKISTELPSHVTAETIQYILNHLHEDPLSTIVNRKEVEGKLEWRVTFLNHFDDVLNDPLRIHPGSDGFSDLSDTLTVEHTGRDGIYPVSYTIWRTGSYYLTIENNGNLVSDQTFTISVENGSIKASSTFAFGQGLTRALAGQESSFFIQSRDDWLREVQIIYLSSNLIDRINEVQGIHISSPIDTEFQLTFRGRMTDILRIGASSLSDVRSALEALDSCGNVLVSSLLGETLVVHGDTIFVEFQTDMGILPLLKTSGSDEIKRYTTGYAPYRSETQIIHCNGAHGTARIRYFGSTAVLNDFDTVEEVAEKLTSLFGCPIFVTDMTNYGSVCSPLGSMFRIDIIEFRDVPSLEIIDYDFQSGSIVVYGDGQDDVGAIDGLGPLMGSFRLSYGDYETDDIRGDASAEEVEQALEKLPTVGSITVSKDSVGLCLDHTGINLAGLKTCGSNLWIIAFGNVNKRCKPPDWKYCPPMIADVSLIQVDATQLTNPSYAPSTIFKPILVSSVIRHGTQGNDVLGFTDTDIVSASFSHKHEDILLHQERFRVEYKDNGLYQLFYTPIFSGHYDTFISVQQEVIWTDLSTGLLVHPARPNAILSSHDSKLTAKVGEVHSFTITAVDPYGNRLISILDDSDTFFVTAFGFPHSCSGQTEQHKPDVDVTSSPGQDGKYIVSFVPKVAGVYDVNILLKSRGGLLTTFYRNVDFTDPFFTPTDSEGVVWCPESSYRCDSTKLSEDINFNWGFESPFAENKADSFDFPLDSFSVSWKGLILSPINGEITFVIKSDGRAQLQIGDITVIDGFKSNSKDILVGKIDLEKDQFYDLELKYIHDIDNAYIKLEWDIFSGNDSVPVSSEYLYYARHVGSYNSSGTPSPFSITSVPGSISPNTFAVGSGLHGCVSMEKCSFSIQTQDIYGNSIYNFAYESGFEISINGIDGWALQGQVNDITALSNPISIENQVDILGWEYVGTFNTVHLSYILTSNSSFGMDIFRGDILSIDEVLYTVVKDAYAGDFQVVLDDVYLGESRREVEVHRVKGSCGETGTNIVSYTGFVRGKYELDVKLPSRHSKYRVSTFAPSSTSISGSFILIIKSEEGNEFSTVDIPYNATEEFVSDAVQDALGLEIINVSRRDCSIPEVQCSWDITLSGINHGFNQTIVSYWDDLLFGSNVDVIMLEMGRESTSISGFPRIITIHPAGTNPIWSTLYGNGLQYAIAGIKNSFNIQPKDSYGNYIDCRQRSEVLWNVIMIPENWNGDRKQLLRGITSETTDCTIKVEYLPTISGKYTIVATGTTKFEKQRLKTSFNSFLRGGSFKLVLNTEITEQLSWNATADEMQKALEKLNAIKSVIVSRESDGPLNSYYIITYNGSVGDLPPLEVDTSSLIGTSGAWTMDSIDGYFEHIMAAPEDVIVHGSYINHVLKGEIQSITIRAFDDISDDTIISISFMGYNTSVSATANNLVIKSSLESLPVIGTVDVIIDIQPNSRVWYVTFIPWSNGNEKNLYNYGNLPQIIATCHKAEVQTDTIRQGYSPFELIVKPSCPNALRTLATDIDYKKLSEVGMSGYYKSQSIFKLFTYDEFENRIYDGPQPEVQIIEIIGLKSDDKLSAKFGSVEVEITPYANPAFMEKTLRQIPSLERIVVTSNSAKTLVDGVYLSVSRGRVTATPSIQLTHFEIGDWIRIGDEESDIYSIVNMQSAPPFEITLSAPYLGRTSSQAFIYKRESRGHQSLYQYIISFDPALGDVPSIILNGNLSAGSSVQAKVISCDQNEMFEIELATTENNALSGSYIIQIGMMTTKSIPVDVDSATLTDILLSSFDSFHSLNVELIYNGLHKKIWRLRFLNTIPEILKHETINIDSRFIMSSESTKVYASITPFCPVSYDGERSRYGMPGLDYFVQLYGPEVVYGDVTYVGEGVYQGSYETPKVGEYKMRVESVQIGGLLGEYFSNRWLFGKPVFSRIDRIIDFYWGEDEPITSTGKDFISIRWSGYLKPSFSEVYTFILRVNDGVRLWIGKEILIDRYDINVADGAKFHEYIASTAQALTADRLIEIKVEFRENRGDAKIELLWESSSQKRIIISSNALYSNPVHIDGSPFSVTPIAIKPSEPQNVTVEVRDFDQVELIWDAPLDPGGEDIVEYLIEYWNASSTDENVEILRLTL